MMHPQIHQSLQEISLLTGEEPIILAPASWDYPSIITLPASLNMDQDSSDTSGFSDLYLGSQHVQAITDKTPYLQAIPIEQATEDMEQLTCPRPTTLCSRASPIEQATGDLEQPTSPGFTDQLQRYNRFNRPASRTTVCPRSPDGQEQPVDQYKTMTPREEEIMRIH